MIVHTALLIRYFASRGIPTLPLGWQQEWGMPAAAVDLVALDAGRQTVHFAKVLAAGFDEEAWQMLEDEIATRLAEFRRAGYVVKRWKAQAILFVPQSRSPRPTIPQSARDSEFAAVVLPLEELLFPDQWTHLDAALDAAAAPTAESAGKESVDAAVAARKLQEAWVERRGEPAPEQRRVAFRDSDDDPAIVMERLRLKTEASFLAAERERALLAGRNFETEIAPRLLPLIDRAKRLPNCYLWMLHPAKAPSAAPETFEDLGHCYANTAAALELASGVEADPSADSETRQRSLELLAEAQSALRSLVSTLYTADDNDQLAAFHWLRNITQDRQIYVSRYMRREDPADPSLWRDLRQRIEALRLELGADSAVDKRRRKLWGKIRHKSSLLVASEASSRDVEILMNAVGELLETGVPPSDPDLRELLLPHLDAFPEQAACPQGFQRFLQEIDRFLAHQARLEQQRSSVPEPPQDSDAVRQVAEILRDRSVLLIGGCRRPHSQEALAAAFGLRELIWLETSEHSSVSRFEPYVSRPDVALVLLAIRWSSHSFGEVSEYCDRYGKPLVRLPSGYNPNQVAEQILRQQGTRLGAGGGIVSNSPADSA
ncbi:MAG: hypothetical protein Kow00109_11560 [Acidobacteriota bacterium]